MEATIIMTATLGNIFVWIPASKYNLGVFFEVLFVLLGSVLDDIERKKNLCQKKTNLRFDWCSCHFSFKHEP